MKIEELRNWATDYAQISFFVPALVSSTVGELFKSTFDIPYEHISEQNYPPHGFLGIATSGKENRLLQLVVQPNRYDFLVRSPDLVQGEPPKAGLSESFAEALDIISAPAAKLLNVLELVSRVAVHGRFAVDCETEASANDAIRKGLPKQIDLNGVSDFVYQENRPDLVNGLHLNRLARYSVERILVTAGHPSPDGRLVASPVEHEHSFGALVLLDFNTVATSPIFKSNDAASALEIIKSEIKRVSGFGD